MGQQMTGILFALLAVTSCGQNIVPSPAQPTDTPTPVSVPGAIAGRVLDAVTGDPVAGAKVSTDPPTSAVTTGANGGYTFTDLAPGAYTVIAMDEENVRTDAQVTVKAGRLTLADVYIRVSDNTPADASDMSTLQPTGTLTLAPTLKPTGMPTIARSATVTPTPLPRLSGSGGGVVSFVGYNTRFMMVNADDSMGFSFPAILMTSFAWSPDGERLAFAGEDGDVYVISLNGTGMTNLTNTPVKESKPSWSPDGKRIAFVADSDLGVMNMDGTDRKRLTTDMAIVGEIKPDSNANEFPVWSPDGTRIAFVSYRNGPSDIYAVKADGSGLVQRIASGVDPNWSPDGQKIAYVFEGDIHIMDQDGSNQTNLTNSQGYNSDPDWSPDGMRIAFSSDRRFPPADPYAELHIMNADGSGLVRLSNYGSPGGGDPQNDAEPDWSPDGRQIAFIEVGWEAFCNVYVVNADGSSRRQLHGTIQSLGAGSFVSQLAWRPE